MSGRRSKATGGGGARHPNSFKNLELGRRNAPAAPSGNGRAVKHGVYATITEQELEPKTREIFDALAQDAPVRDTDGGLPAADALPVRMLAEVMVRRERARTEEIAHGLEIASGPRKGSLRGVVEYGLRLDAQALELAKELGMTPRSRAQLGLDLVRAQRTSLEQEIAREGDVWAQPPADHRDDAVDGTAEDDEGPADA